MSAKHMTDEEWIDANIGAMKLDNNPLPEKLLELAQKAETDGRPLLAHSILMEGLDAEQRQLEEDDAKEFLRVLSADMPC